MDRQAAPAKRSLLFFLLVYVLSVPFWVLGEAPLPLPVKTACAYAEASLLRRRGGAAALWATHPVDPRVN